MPGLSRRRPGPTTSGPPSTTTEQDGSGGGSQLGASWTRPFSGVRQAASEAGEQISATLASVLQSASVWGQAVTAQEEETPLPAGLTEDQLKAAQAWARGAEGPGGNIIRQLQKHLGVPATGSYDRNTVIAVVMDQRARGTGGSVGVASPHYMSSLGLLFTQDVVGAEVEDTLAATLKQNHPDGYTVAFYVHYDVQSNNNKEFERQATPYAERTGALGLQGGSVVQGVPIAIREGSEIVEGLNQIYLGVRQHFYAGLDPYMQDLMVRLDASGIEGNGLDWTKANDVSLFCHGMPGGLSTDAGGSYREGLHSDTYGQSNIESFVHGVRGATTRDVNVQLFACGAGRGTDEKEAWLEHRQDHRMGQASVAQELSTQLGPKASVFAHTTTGHTTENYAGRVFGAEAGGGQGGLHLFDRLFPETFIQSELIRLHPTLDPAQRAMQHHTLRERMWAHYRGSIGTNVPVSRFGARMGQLMFQDPARAAKLLQGEWQAANGPP
ncbi:MAG: hypothetical protein CL927_03035 [Deltaproteobacteria bacterium]|nr:hypothetical protein [Deltaproteobacteria bacterium]HCH66656.1 hypothetical protein [Deltaproteobacteria bacterium]